MRDINNLNREHDDKYRAIYDNIKGVWFVPAIGKYYETKEEAELEANKGV
jgi:hypothetical protein